MSCAANICHGILCATAVITHSGLGAVFRTRCVAVAYVVGKAMTCCRNNLCYHLSAGITYSRSLALFGTGRSVGDIPCRNHVSSVGRSTQSDLYRLFALGTKSCFDTVIRAIGSDIFRPISKIVFAQRGLYACAATRAYSRRFFNRTDIVTFRTLIIISLIITIAYENIGIFCQKGFEPMLLCGFLLSFSTVFIIFLAHILNI